MVKVMKDIGFKKEINAGTFLNPFDDFKNKEVVIEERYDETTGVASRILPFRVRPNQKPDVSAYLAKSPESLCPFCADLFEKTTPKFAADIIPEGKFRRGEACLFPNAFPYDQSSMVAIFSSRHFVPLDQLTPAIMRDGFAVCRDYFTRMSDLKKGHRYCSVNWNYMPPSGGGLIHPHLQTIAGTGPTNFMQRLITSARNYADRHGGNLWRDLIDHERGAGERFIADTGAVCWLAAFSPKGMAGEIDFIFKERRSLFDVANAEFDEMLTGFSAVFKYLSAVNFISFNLALYAAMGEEKDLWVQGKIVPRFEINALGTSDVNYFEKLHDEIICLAVPEQMCSELQPYFR
jgi:UDPglucose--hexose-1-phosphate uridylyltransferase